MITFFDFIIWILVLLSIYAIYWYWSIPNNLPPGPLGLPFLGSYLDLMDGSTQDLICQGYVKKYGPLFTVYVANKLVLVLGDYDTIEEALVKQGDAFLGRVQWHAVLPEKLHNWGLASSEGELWKEQRRFTLTTLRDFGLGRSSLEPKIKQEVECLIDNFKANKNAPFDPFRLILLSVCNNIYAIVFGRRFGYDNQEVANEFMRLVHGISGASIGCLSPSLIWPTLSSLMSYLPAVRNFRAERSKFLDFVERELKTTKAAYDPDSEPSNYVHAYMKAAKNGQGEYFSDEQLLAAVHDLFFAGTATLLTTLRWALLFMGYNRDVQEKVHQEIKTQIGPTSFVDYANRTKLPYTEAVIMETMRLANLVPFGVQRRTLAPTKLMGYDIPADCLVAPLMTNVMHNCDLYPNPTRFDPHRFLDAEGKLKHDPKMIPFQIGKRACLGELMARMELFLFFTGLMNRLRFSFPTDRPLPSLKPLTGSANLPRPFDIQVEARD